MFLENMSFFYLHIGWLMGKLGKSEYPECFMPRCWAYISALGLSQTSLNAMIWQLARNSLQIIYLKFVLTASTDKYGLSRWQLWKSLSFRLQVDCILCPQCRVRTRKKSRNVFWVKWMEKKYPLRFRTLMYLNLIRRKDIRLFSAADKMENVSDLGWKVSKRDGECLRLDSLASHSHKAWQAHDESSAICFSAPSATCLSRISTEPNDASPPYCDTIVAFGCRISLRWSDAGGWDLSFEVIGVVHSSVSNFNQSHLVVQEAPNAVEKVPITRWWLWGCLALNLVHERRCSQTRWSNQTSRHPWGATRMHLWLSRNPFTAPRNGFATLSRDFLFSSWRRDTTACLWHNKSHSLLFKYAILNINAKNLTTSIYYNKNCFNKIDLRFIT